MNKILKLVICCFVVLFVTEKFNNIVSASILENPQKLSSLYKITSHLISSSSVGCVVEIPQGEETVSILVGVPPRGQIRCSQGEVDQIVWLRRHRVAKILVAPFKNEKRRIRINWEGSKGSIGLSEDTPFEDLLRKHIVNYESSKHWVRPRKLMTNSKRTINSYKILVVREGIYRVNYDDICDIIQESIDPKTIKLTHFGLEVPILVKGEEDGTFGSDDWFEFYAKRREGEFTYLDLFSDTIVYWLEFGGLPGARLVNESCNPSQALIDSSYLFKIHFEEDSIYRLFKEYPDTIDPWFWAEFNSEKSFPLEIPTPYLSGNCSLKIVLRTSNGPGQCQVKLNNNYIGRIDFSDAQGFPITFETSFPQSILKDLSELTFDPSVGNIYINSIELKYSRLYKSNNGYLTFKPSIPGIHKFKITGFANPEVKVWKIGTSVIADGKTDYNDSLKTYSYTFQDTSYENTEYIASDFELSPIRIEAISSDLKSSSNRADYIIITNSKLYNSALSYANWKEMQGFTCKVVNTQEIYDEFNFGIISPNAIYDFLKYAFETWSLSPVYVLLLGDASYDHRNILGFGYNDIVPSKTLFDEHLVFIPCDNLYACVSGDDPISDIFLARLPVKDTREFNIVFGKLKQYEETKLWGEWRKNFLLGIGEKSLTDVMEEIIKDYIPQSYKAKRVYYPTVSQPELVDAINKGALFLSYMGHSGQREWGGGLLWREAISGFMNIGRLPFVAVLGCYNAIFDHPEENFMGELFVKSPGGAIAYWGPLGSVGSESKGLIEGPLNAICSYDGDKTKNTAGILAFHGIIECFETTRYPKSVLQQTLLGDPTTPIYSPQQNIDITLIPPSLLPGDSCTIFGELPSNIHGEAILTIYINDTTEFQKVRTPVQGGKFEGKFALPDSITEGSGKVMAYVWSDTIDFTSISRFTIDSPTVYPIIITPDNPTSKDSVLIKVKTFDVVGINWVRCLWGVSPSPWNIISMLPDTEGYFTAIIPPQLPESTVSFKIEFENWDKEIFAACSSYQVLSLPDITTYSKLSLQGTSYVEIGREITNLGQESAPPFEVAFYAIDSSLDTFFLGVDTIFSLDYKKYKGVSVPWTLKEGKAFTVIDPSNIIEEGNEGNNISGISNVPVNLFNVTEEFGTNGWVISLDSCFQCSLSSQSVSAPTVIELKDTILLKDSESGYLTRLRNENSSLLQPINIMIHSDSTNLAIYRWVPDYLRWLFVSPNTIVNTQKLGVFSLVQRKDTIAPKITLNVQDGASFIATNLKIEAILLDPNGIDIIDSKPKIICDMDTIPDSLYSYPTENASICALPLVFRKNFSNGLHTLSFIACDFNGNCTKKTITIHIGPLESVEKYCWGNYPNPVRGDKTKFYFEFTTPPDEFKIELYTISGKLLKTFTPRLTSKIEFDWNLKIDGIICANGVYFYKVFARKGDTKINRIFKLAILR